MTHQSTTSADDLASRVRLFVDRHISPNESILALGDERARDLSLVLSERARLAGLFGSFYPLGHGGRLARLADYVDVAEQEGRSEYGPGILGADATLDAHMLLREGGAVVTEKFLRPLVAGEAVPSYAMSEPDSIGSIPATITCRAQRQDGHWHLSGRKWFISRSSHADFVTVVARTSDGPVESALSMLVVPTDSPGFEVVRPIPLMSRSHGESELSLTDVRVPEDYLLGTEGRGIALMQQRLALGRLLRSARWLGLAQRCFELMCQRIQSPRGQLARLADKQLVCARVYKVYRSIASARGLLRKAASDFDAGRAGMVDVNVTKLAASDAVSEAADCAIQVMGAEGLADWTPLSSIYRTARTTHILDGADDALISAVGRELLASTASIHAPDPVQQSASAPKGRP